MHAREGPLAVCSDRLTPAEKPVNLRQVAVAAGKAGARLRDNDSIEEVMHVMDHDHILFFTSDGIVRSRRAFQLPQGSRTSGGTPITQASPISRSWSHPALLAPPAPPDSQAEYSFSGRFAVSEQYLNGHSI